MGTEGGENLECSKGADSCPCMAFFSKQTHVHVIEGWAQRAVRTLSVPKALIHVPGLSFLSRIMSMSFPWSKALRM